ncbi:hypothetical protein WN944_014929 [Citrus x changshan-huyou]|uniref:Uncharacterized protein n=1 Tax=Citrus x changshan-huyou TaxID=2935761 RepID=A0AAP0MAS1_9ROSI
MRNKRHIECPKRKTTTEPTTAAEHELAIQTTAQTTSDGGLEKGADEGKTNSVHLSQHSDHISDFHVVDEGLDDFAVEANEEDVEAVDPPWSQSLKSNTSHRSRRSMGAHSQSKVAIDQAEDTVPTDDLPSEIVRNEPCKRKRKNASKSPITITHSHRQANKKKSAVVQIRASQRITNQRMPHSTQG